MVTFIDPPGRYFDIICGGFKKLFYRFNLPGFLSLTQAHYKLKQRGFGNNLPNHYLNLLLHTIKRNNLANR